MKRMKGKFKPVHDLLCHNLNVQRKLRALSRVEMEGIVNVSHQQYSKYESGVNRISAVALYYICKEFDITMDSLFVKDEENADIPIRKNEKVSRIATKHFLQLKNPNVRNILNALMDELVKDQK